MKRNCIITTLTLLMVVGSTALSSAQNKRYTAPDAVTSATSSEQNKKTVKESNSAMETKSTIKDLTPKEFQEDYEKSKENAILLDVRRPDEYQNGHLKGATLINLMDEKFAEEVLKLDSKKTIFIYCRSGRRSMKAAEFLTGKGYTCVNMKGGILAWGNEGFPVEQ
ncbi:MAG: hypothetical protein KBT32_00880 [Bacteroidales bacterium]|nr:hypothetical protein [Candidatus Physcocola equi]